jgi:citrate lyase subunit beta / citryl-CoA lyase
MTHTQPTSVTWLFAPGNRPERFIKAVRSGADEVVCDLEDSVSASEKTGARLAVTRWLGEGGRAWVRVNGLGTEWFEDDVRAVNRTPGLLGVVVPKAEDPEQVSSVAARIGGRPVVALVETAVGLHHAVAIGRAPGVYRLAFGSIDFALDIDADDEHEALRTTRCALVLASRVAGLPGPIDGVTAALHDHQVAGEDAARSRALGFTAKLLIHPGQVGPVERAMRPTPAEIAWAKDVITRASSLGVGTSTGGQMIDLPVIARAKRVLDRGAEQAGALGGTTCETR